MSANNALVFDSPFAKHDFDLCFNTFEESKLKSDEYNKDINRYGLTPKNLIHCRSKVKKQEDFLKNNTFITSLGQEKSLADVSFGANTSKRYYARILNKVDTFVSLNMARDYVPVFLTVTLDGFFRDFLTGNYKRWTDEKKVEYKSHIPNNDRNGHFFDLIEKRTKLTPKDLYKIISHQLHRFTRSSTLQKIRKNGDDYSFIRVTEPHKDGVPHFHILLYVPEQYLSGVYKEFKKFFPAPQNHKKINYRDNKRDAALIADDLYETQGFQTKIRSVTGYILKYILKSFRNFIENDEIDYLQAWYIHNRIPRIITTHTLIPQDIYYKTSILDDDWYYLSNIKHNEVFINDRDNDYFKFSDGHARDIIGDNGFFVVYNCGKLVKSYGEKKFTLPKYRLRSFRFSVNKPDSFCMLNRYIILIPPKKYSYYRLQVFNDGTQFLYGSHSYFSFTFLSDFVDETDNIIDIQFEDDYNIKNMNYDKLTGKVFFDYEVLPVSHLSYLQLYDFYENFDFDKNNPAKFGLVKNRLIDLGILNEKKVNLNDFNTNFYDIGCGRKI